MTASAAAAHEDELNPHWVSRAAFQVVSVLFMTTEVLIAVSIYHGWIWLTIPLALIASHFMHGSLIGFHEASHGLLRKNRLINDIDGTIIGAISFMSFTLYRVMHQTHHAHLSEERDEELWPFVRPGTPRWARCLAAFLELNVGVLYVPFLFLRSFLRKGGVVRSKRVRRRIWAELLLSVVMWAAIWWAVAHFGVWEYFIWMYVVPAVIAGNLQSWRKYIEHVGLTGNTPNSSTRSIIPQTWMGHFFSVTLLHEPFHGIHHQRAGLTHYELPAHVADLEPKAPGERQPFQSYAQATVDLIRSLADPKVGIQWIQCEPLTDAQVDAQREPLHS